VAGVFDGIDGTTPLYGMFVKSNAVADSSQVGRGLDAETIWEFIANFALGSGAKWRVRYRNGEIRTESAQILDQYPPADLEFVEIDVKAVSRDAVKIRRGEYSFRSAAFAVDSTNPDENVGEFRSDRQRSRNGNGFGLKDADAQSAYFAPIRRIREPGQLTPVWGALKQLPRAISSVSSGFNFRNWYYLDTVSGVSPGGRRLHTNTSVVV